MDEDEQNSLYNPYSENNILGQEIQLTVRERLYLAGKFFGFGLPTAKLARIPNFFKATKIVNAVEEGFKIEGQLKQIFENNRLFSNWLKANQSLSRISKPLNATEAEQIISNAKKLGLPIESNLKGLQGLEKTGQWGGIYHFKVGNVHIPIKKGLDVILKF